MNVSDQDLLLFLIALKSSSNYDFSEYSDKSLKRRLAKVLTDYKLDIPSLIANMRSNQAFVEKLIKDITVNTTELFRDPQVWQNLKYKLLPKFQHNKTINIWHAGCSTGQEVYSLMILLNEMNLLEKTKIYASDINTDVLDAAKKGVYKYRFNIGYLDNFDKVIKENPYNYEEYKDVPYSKYFQIDKVKDTIHLNDFLLNKPIFKKHDLVKDGNTFYTKFDLILCRNVVIYFNYELQNKVFDLFHECLFHKGTLVLGLHESILGPMSAKYERNGQFYSRYDQTNDEMHKV
jgi:chemotaxis protein methyltransferase CheR